MVSRRPFVPAQACSEHRLASQVFTEAAWVRRTPCRSAARTPHERSVDVTPISLRRLRPLQRLVRRRTLVLGSLRDSSLSPPLPAPRFADLPRLPPQALIAAASGTTGDTQSHAGPEMMSRPNPPIPVRLSSRLSVERFAVQRSGRRQAGAAILRRCPCGDQIRCNALFDSALAMSMNAAYSWASSVPS